MSTTNHDMTNAGLTEPILDPLAPPKQMTLEQLLQLVKVVLSDNLPDTYWVVAEIAEFKHSPRGYCHLTFVQKNGDTLVAKINAVMWRPATQSLLPRFRSSTGKDLAPGMNVLVRVGVTFHTAYGMQLEVHDVDPNYTLGEMARKRREILERLENEGRLTRNKALSFPLCPQRIAVISSATAAGYEDFVAQITGNIHGFAFRVQLFPSLMQGNGAEAQVVAALAAIARDSHLFDAVVMIRGGGSTVDLSCFDSYAIGAAIADFPLPVITGIGHERDDSVADLCANTRVKTPTAAAEHLIGIVRAYSDRVEYAWSRIATISLDRICDEKMRIEGATRTLTSRAIARADLENARLQSAAASIRSVSARTTERSGDRLERIDSMVRLLDPANILKRGYSITYAGGRAVTSAIDVVVGSTLTTKLYNGTIESTVEAKTPASDSEETNV
ncbi:MAG TPA: exodeoxyribonuclease VII large subunit [Capsulimonadaceae bacterium]